MTDEKMMRLSQVARKLNVGASTIAEHLATKGFKIENNPNTKISLEQFNMLAKEFESSALDKEEALGLTIGKKHSDNFVVDKEFEEEERKKEEDKEFFIKNITVDKKEKPHVEPEPEKKQEQQPKHVEEVLTTAPRLQGIKILGKIDLHAKKSKKEEPPIEKKEEVIDEKPQQMVEEVPEVEEANIEEVITPEEESIEDPVIAVVNTPEPEEVVEEEVEEEIEEVTSVSIDQEEEKPEYDLIEAKAEALKGLTVLGKIELPREKPKKKEKPVASSDEKDKNKKKRPRKRIKSEEEAEEKAAAAKKEARPAKASGNSNKIFKKTKPDKEEPSDKEIQDQIRATLAKLSGGKKGAGPVNRSKYRREKRSAMAEANEEKMLQEQENAKTLKVTEFISANDLASMMGVTVNEVISTCLSLGMFVSINQRLDAEAITVIADEFGFDADFASSDEEIEVEVEEDDPEDIKERAPIVTIMGHVDHGKTSLLDYIRHSKVTEAEAGGITQHIGAYDVVTESGKRIAFLDTPGHEAFTAMRARGAKITDVVIIVVAADDNVMPQTKEAINHAQVAGVPIVIAINKIDKPNANPEKIREELSKINILVEDWGGKYQCQEISAKSGKGVNDLLEKVLLESEMLELKTNPDKKAVGTVIEATLDKGRGYVATVMVQSGTLHVGDVMLAGSHFGKVKAMFNHLGHRIKEAPPSTPVQVLGIDGAPQAGDKFNVMETEREAREIANKREQIQREQNLRTKKHITLDEIGRRLAIGSFKELNVIVKGDVDGSIEALSDSLLKLSTGEVQVNIIHKAVGQISESDVLLASASDAIIVGFQVRPSNGARRIAEQEQIEIRLYSIIYDAINEVKDAMEGMLAPKVEEVITGIIEVRDVFKISKVGTVAGCYVLEGYIKRNNKIRLVRDGIVVHTGNIDQLKRFKDDVSEVKYGYECGLSIKNFNDIQLSDTIEGFEEKEVKRTL